LNTVVESEFNEGDIFSAVQDIQAELMVESATQYDLLTDLAQLSDIPRLILSVTNDLMKIIGAFKSRNSISKLKAAKSFAPADLLRHPYKWMRKIGDEWMAYRYGVMTLVYSYRDLMKTLNRGTDVKTRKGRTITPTNTGQAMLPSSSYYWKKSATGSVQLRGEVFQHFSSDEIARISGLGFNPFVTAWELIPYSFVLDWFVNVGDYIATRVNQTWSELRWACLSRRDITSSQTWLHQPNRDQSIIIGNIIPTGWVGTYPPSTPNQIISNPEGFYIFDKEDVDSYSRWPILVSGAPLKFRPSLNWRRYMDSASIALNLLGRFTRPFR